MACVLRIQQFPRYLIAFGQDRELPYPIPALPELSPQLFRKHLFPQVLSVTRQVLSRVVWGAPAAYCELVEPAQKALYCRTWIAIPST